MRNAKQRLAAKKLKDAPPRTILTSDKASPLRLQDGCKVLPRYFTNQGALVSCDLCKQQKPAREFSLHLTYDASAVVIKWHGTCNFCLAAEASRNNVAGMLGVRKPNSLESECKIEHLTVSVIDLVKEFSTRLLSIYKEFKDK